MVHITNRQSISDFLKQLRLLAGMSNNMLSDGAAAGLDGLRMPRFTDKTGLTGLFEFNLDFDHVDKIPTENQLSGGGRPVRREKPEKLVLASGNDWY